MENLAYPIGMVVLVFVLGIISLFNKENQEPKENYISDQDWLNSGGKIIYTQYGKERVK